MSSDAPARFVPAIAATAVQPDVMRSVVVGGHILILTRHDNEIVAFSAGCPHAGADLREGILGRGTITCADHDYKFDLASGRPLWPPDEGCRLRKFDTRERDGVIEVLIP